MEQVKSPSPIVRNGACKSQIVGYLFEYARYIIHIWTFLGSVAIKIVGVWSLLAFSAAVSMYVVLMLLRTVN